MEAFLPQELRNLDQQNIMLQSKHFVGESVAVIVSLLLTPLDSYICELWEKNDTVYCTVMHSIFILLENVVPVLYCHLTGTGNEFSNGHSTVLSVQLLDIREFDKTDEFHEHGLIAVLILL